MNNFSLETFIYAMTTLCSKIYVCVRIPIIIIIIIILLKQDYKIQLTNKKIQMAWLTSWVVFG